jgi:transmembrane sensor
VALGLFLWGPRPVSPETAVIARHVLPLIEQRTMADGSVVELNWGAIVTEDFTPGERRVRLVHGEAHFKVAKDAQRPFVVEVSGVAVRAVGTEFNVRLGAASVEVLVTEGKVRVDARPDHAAFGTAAPGLTAEDSLTFLSAGEHTVVSLAPVAPAPKVVKLTSTEIEARLAWLPRLLDFDNEPLAAIAVEFNRRNPVRLTLDDASLGRLRLSASFRSDNVDGFVRLMESNFGMRAEWRGEDEIVLRPAK